MAQNIERLNFGVLCWFIKALVGMKYLFFNKSQIVWVLIMLVLGVISAIVYGKMTTSVAEAPAGYFDVKLHQNKSFPQTELFSSELGMGLNAEVLHGKTLLVYLETNCSGCQVEADLLAQDNLLEKYGVKVFLVGFQGINELENFKKKYKLGYPIFNDKDHKLRLSLGVESFPSNFFINNGKIERSWVGINKDSTLQDLVEKMGLANN